MTFFPFVSVLSDLNSTSKCVKHQGEYVNIPGIPPRTKHEACLSSSSRIPAKTVYQAEILDCFSSLSHQSMFTQMISAVNI